MVDEEKGRVLGHGPCPNCGHSAAYKINKKGHLYVYCVVEGDGGCHSGTQSRSAKGDTELAKRITKWTKAEDRKKYLGEAAAPAEQPKKSIWDMEIKL
jgi:hypothetical protein